MATEPLCYAAETPWTTWTPSPTSCGHPQQPVSQGRHPRVPDHRRPARGLVPGFAGSLGYEFGDVVAEALEDELEKMSRIQNIRTTWNKLIEVASEWKGDDEFATERWQTVRICEAEDEEKFQLWKENEMGTATESASFVSEYRVPGQRRGGEYVVTRDPENANLWAVFEGTAQARHWDGTAWQHARLTGTGPYLFARTTALTLAHQHVECDVADEETSR